MRIGYKGMDAHYKYRVAEISCDDSNEKDMTILQRMGKLFEINGYKLDVVTPFYALIEVDDFADFKEVLELYKRFKKHITLWIKYGH